LNLIINFITDKTVLYQLSDDEKFIQSNLSLKIKLKQIKRLRFWLYTMLLSDSVTQP